MGETMQERADRLRKRADEKRPEFEARAKALREKFDTDEKRAQFKEVEERLREKAKRFEGR